MELQLSAKTKAKIFNRKMKREGYEAKVLRWQNKVECMMTHTDRVYNTLCERFSLRIRRNNLMGEYNTPIYNIRASRIIRDTERFIRMWQDPEIKRKKLEQSRYDEVRGEIKDKFRSLLNRENFWGYTGK